MYVFICYKYLLAITCGRLRKQPNLSPVNNKDIGSPVKMFYWNVENFYGDDENLEFSSP